MGIPDSASHSPFEQIPVDLVLKILEFAPESLHFLCVTSRTLRSRIDECALFPASIPLCEELTIVGTERECERNDRPTILEISITIPLAKSRLFELRLLHLSADLMKRMTRRSFKTMVGDETEPVYSLTFNSAKNDNICLECLQIAIGRRVEKLNLLGCSDCSTLKIVSNFISRMRPVKLEVTLDHLSDISSKTILWVTKTKRIHHLWLNVTNIAIVNPGGLLLELSSIVSSLYIHQREVHEIKGDRVCFFGVENLDWAPIFIEMFSKKMDKLFIVNEAYDKYLSRSDMYSLKKKLTKLDKQVWFTASCVEGYYGFYQHHEDYVIRDDRVYVRIIHKSRQNESF